MNVENIKILRDVIASQKYIFDMNTPEAKPQCGSGGCIGGHMSIIWPDVRSKSSDDDELLYDGSKCAKKLGLTEDQIDDMFYHYPRFPTASRQEALDMIDQLIATGEVLWS